MEKSEEFVKKLTCKEFMKDEKTHYAVVRCIEIIGEAAKHVPQIMRKKYPEIPWKDMAGMRDKIVHFYFGLNLEKILNKRALSPLKYLFISKYKKFDFFLYYGIICRRWRRAVNVQTVSRKLYSARHC
ncbi:MAG: HepT-like ribonuclease domain-containing protein [Candidatus Omnitrophota bacterium]